MLKNKLHYIAIQSKLDSLRKNINSYLTTVEDLPDATTLFSIEKSIENDIQQIEEIY